MGEDEVANDVEAGKQEHADLQRTKKEEKKNRDHEQDHYFVCK